VSCSAELAGTLTYPPAFDQQPEPTDEFMISNNKYKQMGFTPVRRPTFPVIAGYRFIQPIASSPHAAVYLAHSTELGHDVAIKVLRNSDRRELTPEQVLRFERERELLMRVKHRSVVDIYDWGHLPEQHFLVTEYFPAGSLELRIRNLMTVRDSIDVFLQIAAALIAIHRGGLCHRDLKPANVMLRADGSIVLIDFGLAMALESTQITKVGEVHGSPYYISPEQVDGSSNGDHRSDLYSLGVMFYEMLSGTRPFQGKTVFDVVNAHRSAPVPHLVGDLVGFDPIIQSLLNKDPNQRAQSASEALAALSKLKV
jgi:eukaryotic-like serine/threonine-protein kinase